MSPLLIGSLLFPALAAPPLQPKPTDDEAYAETYTAVASLNDGSFVLLQLLFTNAGFGDRKAACRGLWVPPGGTGINASANMDEDEWTYDAATQTLQAGPCSLGPHKGGLRFQTNFDDLQADLRIDGKARSIQPPDYRITAGQTFHESDLVVPWATAQASLQADGRKSEQSGAVHLDHAKSNSLLPKIASCWARYRGFFGDTPLLLQVRVPPSGQAPTGWTWPLDEAAPSAASSTDITLEMDSNSLPKMALLHQGEAITVTATDTLYRYRPTASYGTLGRLAAPWIGDPTTTTYRATASTPTGKTVTGILEVSEIDEPGCRTQ